MVTNDVPVATRMTGDQDGSMMIALFRDGVRRATAAWDACESQLVMRFEPFLRFDLVGRLIRGGWWWW